MRSTPKRCFLMINEHFEDERNAEDTSLDSFFSFLIIISCIMRQIQGLQSPKKRSLLGVNEHFENKRNAEDASLDDL